MWLVAAALAPGPAAAGGEAGLSAYLAGDFAAAEKEWRPLAQKGEAEAQYGLGLLLLDGLGVARDETKGADWIRRAAEQGHLAAETKLGQLYGTGRGVTQDFAAAAAWLARAAERGDAEAQSALGYLYQTGEGVEQNDAAAFALYRRAAEQGLAAGQLNLGVMYATGRGTPQDYVQAHLWFNLAAAQGDRTAAENRDRIGAKMTAIQIQEAQKLAREWRPRVDRGKPAGRIPAPGETGLPPAAVPAQAGLPRSGSAGPADPKP